jgi:hypothetical protein
MNDYGMADEEGRRRQANVNHRFHVIAVGNAHSAASTGQHLLPDRTPPRAAAER